MTFETDTFDLPESHLQSPEVVGVLTREQLCAGIEAAITALSPRVLDEAPKVRSRLCKAMWVKSARDADELDLRDGLLIVRGWLHKPATYRRPRPARPKIQRPEGNGKLPVPRTAKYAGWDTSCALCADPVKAGDLIGRMRPPQTPYAVMGWLCGHCLYRRRAEPRRRDILLRFFHHLFAGSGIGLNDIECGVLLTWLTEDQSLAASDAWLNDSLDGTIARLRTSVEEEKPTTWLSVPTGTTILTVLREARGGTEPSQAETEMLDAIGQHLEEWETNPQRLAAFRYGTGSLYRLAVLLNTSRPTVLSVRGGPFDLHQTPPPPSDQGTEGSDSDDVSLIQS